MDLIARPILTVIRSILHLRTCALFKMPGDSWAIDDIDHAPSVRTSDITNPISFVRSQDVIIPILHNNGVSQANPRSIAR
jgi:hypothetical protein